MKGFILAAGLGTRLKPWTDCHPKALAPVNGKPMLQRVVEKMHAAGIFNITVNCFHFPEQIKEFVDKMGWKVNIVDETPKLLETGGAILNAANYLMGNEPILVHNVDILSNADFRKLDEIHKKDERDATLLVSDRESSRKLIFAVNDRLVGWHSITSGEYRPADFVPLPKQKELSFSGIYVISPSMIETMQKLGWNGRFSIMDYFLTTLSDSTYKGYFQKDLELIDIGKPEALKKANSNNA